MPNSPARPAPASGRSAIRWSTSRPPRSSLRRGFLARFDEAQIEADVRASGVRLYRYGSDNIAGQAPASFKDAAAVVAAMSAFDLIQPVARLRPIAVLKG